MANPQEAPVNKLNLADALVLVTEAVGILRNEGFIVLNNDGSHFVFVDPGTGKDISAVSDIEQLLKQHKLAVPDKVDKIIRALPAIAPFLGA